MKQYFIKLVFAVFILAAMFACSKADEEPSYSSSDLVGKWKEVGTSTYWRYDSDGSGLSWNTDDDVQEDDETTMHFTWSLSGDQLRHVFTGDEVSQAVVQDYTILELSGNTMRWDTGLNTISLTKIN